jgi:tRNA pseudouridine38-40 synthase
MRYFAQIAYRGTHFNGWQSQKSDARTVQEEIEKALNTLSSQYIPIVGCGRTDSGVHASDYYFHFDSEDNWEDKAYRLNALLDYDVAVYKIFRVEPEAHARFDAIQRTYHYHLHTYKNPFSRGLSYHYHGKIDLDRLNLAASLLIGYDDFTTFCKSGSDVKHKRCNITKAEWTTDSKSREYKFEIKANRFLRGMVRLIVGTCLNISRNKVTLDDLRDALDKKKSCPYPWSVPAEGLYLQEIEYPFIKHCH